MTECTTIVVIIAVERILVNNFSTLQHSGLFLNVTEFTFFSYVTRLSLWNAKLRNLGDLWSVWFRSIAVSAPSPRSPRLYATLTLGGACECACAGHMNWEQPVTFQLHNLVSVTARSSTRHWCSVLADADTVILCCHFLCVLEDKICFTCRSLQKEVTLTPMPQELV